MLTSIVDRIERWETLDRVSETVQPIVSRLVGTGSRLDLLTGRWLGHAVHPAAVLAPIGCWVGAGAADLIGGRGASTLARRLVGAGVLSAAPASATGMADWADTHAAEQRVGVVHALMNSAAVATMAASWLVRRRGHHGTGAALSAVGLLGVTGAGFLGGHLAYARGVGVSTTAFQSGPDEWTRLIAVDDLADDGLTEATLGDVSYVVARQDGDIRVLENRCTHRGGPLADGSLVGDCVECPWHGSRFSIDDGTVTSGPASVPQPAYEVRVTDGSVEIRRTEVGDLRAGVARAS